MYTLHSFIWCFSLYLDGIPGIFTWYDVLWLHGSLLHRCHLITGAGGPICEVHMSPLSLCLALLLCFFESGLFTSYLMKLVTACLLGSLVF